MTFCLRVEAPIGIEPMNNGFAIRSLSHLGTAPSRLGSQCFNRHFQVCQGKSLKFKKFRLFADGYQEEGGRLGINKDINWMTLFATSFALVSCLGQPGSGAGEEDGGSAPRANQNVQAVGTVARLDARCDCQVLVPESARTSYQRVANLAQARQIRCSYLSDSLPKGVSAASLSIEVLHGDQLGPARLAAQEAFSSPADKQEMDIPTHETAVQILTGITGKGQLRVSTVYVARSHAVIQLRESIRRENAGRVAHDLFLDRSHRFLHQALDNHVKACAGESVIKE